MSEREGLVEYNEARGGTGYVATAGTKGCGLDYCPTYDEMIKQTNDLAPDLIVISGGRNDGAPNGKYQDVVEMTIRDAQTKWPAAHVVITSPIWDDDQPPKWLAESIQDVRAAATAAHATYLDIGEPLVGHTDCVGNDGVHPNDAGHNRIAEAVLGAPGLIE